MTGPIAAFASGLLFAIGLGISGMTRPAKVIGFLDVSGAWDASLAFVMVGAIGVHLVLMRLILRRRAPLAGGTFQLSTRKDIDRRLVAGATLFGIGWGIGGYCPGPALASLPWGASGAPGAPGALVFVGTMAVGMLVHRALQPGPKATTA